MRVLDLGCGRGQPLTTFKLSPADWVIGLDLAPGAIQVARSRYPSRTFVVARGEQIPLRDGSVDRVVSNVALPYMTLPQAIREIRRVLKPGGCLMASLHPWTFTAKEFVTNAFPRPKAMLHRLRVFLNGITLHAIGKADGESFQTKRGMTMALRCEGFQNISFFHIGDGRWFVSATRSTSPVTSAKFATQKARKFGPMLAGQRLLR